MPNSLSPLASEPTDASKDDNLLGRPPIRLRLQRRIDAIGASVPTRHKVPEHSVTPIY